MKHAKPISIPKPAHTYYGYGPDAGFFGGVIVTTIIGLLTAILGFAKG